MRRGVMWMVLAAVVCVARTVSAADGDKTPVPPAIKFLQDKGKSVMPLGESHGFQGWLATSNGEVQVFYTAANGSAMVMGVLVDGEGHDLTSAQIATVVRQLSSYQPFGGGEPKAAPVSSAVAAPKDGKAPERRPPTRAVMPPPAPGPEQPPPPAAKLAKVEAAPLGQPGADGRWKQFEQMRWVRLGKESAPPIYLLADPNSRPCKEAWDVLDPLVREGKLQVRLALVSYVRDSSLVRAAAILASRDPEAAWRRNMDGFGEEGAYPVSEVPGGAREMIGANNEIMRGMNLRGTPVVAIRGKDGAVEVIQGVTNNMASVVEAGL